jgi:hypothetical protein
MTSLFSEIALVLAAVLLLASAWMAARTLSWHFRTLPAEGAVQRVEVEVQTGDSLLHHYRPVIRFQLPGGYTVLTPASVRSTENKWQPGQRISLRYEPEHPQEARISSFRDTWLMPLLLGLPGLLLLLIRQIWL